MAVDITKIMRKNMCRLCLGYNKAMSSIYYHNSICSLVDKIKSLASVQILPNDGLPSLICSECRTKVENYVDFRMQIENSYNYLLNMVRNQSSIVKNVSLRNESHDVAVLPTSSAELIIQQHDNMKSNKVTSVLKDKKINIISDTVVKTVNKSINMDGGFQPILGNTKIPVDLFNEVLDIDLLSQNYNRDLCLNKINLNFQINNNISSNRYDVTTNETNNNNKLTESGNIVDDQMTIYIKNKNLNACATELPVHNNHTTPLEINNLDQQLLEEDNIQNPNVCNNTFDALGIFLKSQTNLDYNKLKLEMQNLKCQNDVIKTEVKQDQLWKNLAKKGIIVVEENKDHPFIPQTNVDYLKRETQNWKSQNDVIKTEGKEDQSSKNLAQKGFVIVEENKNHQIKPQTNIVYAKLKQEMQNFNSQNDIKAEEKQDQIVLWKKPAQKSIVVKEEKHAFKPLDVECQIVEVKYDISEIEDDSSVSGVDSENLENSKDVFIKEDVIQQEMVNLEQFVILDHQTEIAPRMSELHRFRGRKTDRDINKHTYVCHLCLSSFTSSDARVAEAHSAEHSKNADAKPLRIQNTPPFYCEICDKVFSTRQTLISHQRMHFNIYPFKCKFCAETYISPELLKVHEIRHVKSEDDYKFKCSVCEKQFKSNPEYQYHKHMHLPKDKLMCPTCDKVCANILTLRIHQKRHDKKCWHVCKECPAAFFTKINLIRHEQMHRGRKLYSCNECQKAFYTNFELKRHQRYHSKDKRHICNICNTAFYEAGHLKIHMTTHTKNYKHICDICGKALPTMSKLNRHLKVHSDKNVPNNDKNGVSNMHCLMNDDKFIERSTNESYIIVTETGKQSDGITIQNESDMQMYTDEAGKLYFVTGDFKNNGIC